MMFYTMVYTMTAVLVTILVLIAIDQKWVPLPDRVQYMDAQRSACIGILVAIITGVIWPVLILVTVIDLLQLLVNYVTKTQQFAQK